MFEDLPESPKPKMTRIGILLLACLVGSCVLRAVDLLYRPPHVHSVRVVPQLLSVVLLCVPAVLTLCGRYSKRHLKVAK